jgi:hypothetical protein
MAARYMTRRSLLVATAGAVAGGLTRPGGALAALAGRGAPGGVSEPIMFEYPVGALPAGVAGVRIELRRNADLVGVRWIGAPSARIELRFRDERGSWSPWVPAGAHGHGPEGASRSGMAIGDPVWTGGTSEVQLRANGIVRGVRLHLVDVSGGVGARIKARGWRASSAALALAKPVLDAGPGQPPIIARRAWARGVSPPRVAPEYGTLRMAFVHHTENPNGYSAGEVPAMLRAIYAFHRYVNGWDDIGYNFVIDRFGRIFEARAGGIDEPVIGAHAGGYNYASTGVAVLGSFMSAPISAAARNALERLLAWKLSLHGIPIPGRVSVRVNPAGAVYSRYPANTPVSLPRVAGHRDADSTDCPGNVLYGELPALRSRIHRLAGAPARVTLTLAGSPSGQAPGGPQSTPPPGIETGSGVQRPPPVEGPMLIGALRLLDGTPLAGARVAIQARVVSHRGEAVSEQTLVALSTDTQGRFSTPASFAGVPAGRLWLRALCPGSSAVGVALSDPLRVTVVAPPVSSEVPVPNPSAAVPPAT